MDSDSDWDSLSEGGPDIGDVSVSIAADSTRQAKHTPRPPSVEKPQSATSKTPLQKADQNDNRNVPRVAEQYRNITNKGVTVFQDSRNRDEESEKETVRSTRNSMHMSPQSNRFHEIELKENIRKNDNIQTASESNRKRSQMKDSNENLPFTEFEVSDASPRKRVHEREVNQPPKNRFRQEYISQSPVLSTASQQKKKKSMDAKRKSHGPSPMKDSFKQKENTTRGVLIVNENAEGYGSGDTENDFSWYNGQNEVKKGQEIASKSQVALLNMQNQQTVLEERYLYDDGVRSYYSIYVDGDAKMPAIATKFESYTKRGVQEFFGTLQILIDFVVIFVVELLRFMLKQFGKKLIGGTVTAVGDFLIKPVFTAIFNSVIQPIFILLWNVMYGFRRLLDPVIALSYEILSQLAMVLKAVRLVELKWTSEKKHVQSI